MNVNLWAVKLHVMRTCAQRKQFPFCPSFPKIWSKSYITKYWWCNVHYRTIQVKCTLQDYTYFICFIVSCEESYLNNYLIFIAENEILITNFFINSILLGIVLDTDYVKGYNRWEHWAVRTREEWNPTFIRPRSLLGPIWHWLDLILHSLLLSPNSGRMTFTYDNIFLLN